MTIIYLLYSKKLINKYTEKEVIDSFLQIILHKDRKKKSITS